MKDGRDSYDIRPDISQFLDTVGSLVDNRSLLEKRLMFIRYESLVTQPTIVMDRVWQFLGLDPMRVDSNTRWATKRPPSDKSYSELDGKPVSATQIGKNRKRLDGNILSHLEEIRKSILKQTRFDVFADDVAADGSNARFT